jgi:DnaJ domain
MDKLFAGPLGIILVIAQAAFFIYMMRGLFETVSEDGIGRTFKPKRSKPKRPTGEAPPRRPEASRGGSRGWTRTSRTLETYYDVASGAMTGRVVEGAYSGRRLEDLSRTELMRLHEICRAEDPEAAEFLESYAHRRFAEPDKRARREERAPPPPPPADGPMTRERAFMALGLPFGASDDEIHHAYRALIMKHHPDHGGTHAKAAEINQAKDMLLG